MILKPFQKEVLSTILKDIDNKKQVLLIDEKRCGKTYIALVYAILSLITSNQTVGFITYETQKIDNEFLKLIRQIKNQFNSVTLNELNNYTTSQNPKIYTFNNKSSIYFITPGMINTFRRGIRFNKLIFDDFDFICNDKNPNGGMELMLQLLPDNNMTFITTSTKIKKVKKNPSLLLERIYQDLDKNIIITTNKDKYHSNAIADQHCLDVIEKIPQTVKIKIYTKVDFDTIKSKLKAKSQNENKPIWLKREMINSDGYTIINQYFKEILIKLLNH